MSDFSQAILSWYQQHGRQSLPWQLVGTPYAVWISEIMLQQTQVHTVIPYFQRFIARFKDVPTLACADQDEVLHLWTGLGYYARARNLHLAAQTIVDKHAGQLPDDLQALQALPGIGRSTAGAILSLGFHRPAPILDGNVKRVLARVDAVPTWPGQTQTLKQLWQRATELTPEHAVHHYNQAMMDLGALVCTRAQPKCQQCPVQRFCKAHQNNLTNQLPVRKPKKDKPIKSLSFLLMVNGQQVLLQQRPQQGIWGGLWVFPEGCANTDGANLIAEHRSALAQILLGYDPHSHITKASLLPTFRHTFTHYHLDISPVVLHLKAPMPALAADKLWYDLQNPPELGLAAPVKQLLAQLKQMLIGTET